MNNIFDTIKMFKDLSFIVIGDAMLDVYIKGSSERLCREAPVPIVAVKDKYEFAGGAANTAVNVKNLHAKCYFISVVGYDPEGDTLLKILHSNRVETSFIERETRQTLSKQRIFSQSQQVLRFDQGGYQSISPVIEENIIISLSDLYKKCNGIIISDYGYGVMTNKVIETIKKFQKQFNKILVIDAKIPERYHSLSPTLVKPNFQETIHLLNLNNEVIQERMLFVNQHKNEILEKTGARIAAVTVDDQGSIILQQSSKPVYTSTIPVENSKAAGAGDTYTSAFALSLAAHASIIDAATIAAKAAEVVIQKDLTATCSDIDLFMYYFSENKKILPSYIFEFINNIKSTNKRIVFTNGCFDILHSGHIAYLNRAKEMGDILIVGLNSDESVKRLKGKERPINTLEDRMNVLSGLKSVDYIIPFEENTPISLIKKIRPDVYVKGGDYTKETLPEVPIVESQGGRVEIIPYVKDHSTTQIIQHIQASKKSTSPLYRYE